ncbi:MAG TPA: hypothetical protein VH142_15665 [Polyangiaceae bacterium]|jgi:hypothetical protein|nr:hypothetical protein [Polyangiaceae bacterium]
MKHLLLASLAFLVVVAFGAIARAADSNEALFSEAVGAMDRGAIDDAIDRFELLADRGFSHPDASYDRALAYVKRAQSSRAKAGDLGRAAAGFSEAVLARPNDTDAERGLDRVRQEIVRRRARGSAKDVEVRPSLGRAIVGVLDENTWAWLAIVGSVALSIGLVLRLFVASQRARLTGAVAASLGALVFFVATGMAFAARKDRLDYRPAVVVVEEARLLDDNGVTINGPGSIVPEGAEVEVGERRGTLAHVEWGTLDGFLSLGQLRLLAATR